MRTLNPRLDIDLAAICANYRLIARAAPGAEAAGVVKCDAYGLGAEAVGRALHRRVNCRSFFVAYFEEGAALRQAIGPDADIFVFNGPVEESLHGYCANALTPVLNTVEQAARWSREMPDAPAALHIDTGMNRLGLGQEEIPAIKSMADLNVGVIMSHLSCASHAAHPMNDRQHQIFAEIARAFPRARKSLASSGGALINRKHAFDMVRIGVGLYGVNPLDDAPSQFAAVATLTAPIIQIHVIRPGETVGYGATFIAEKEMRLATALLGYGDGYPRAASGRGAAFLAGALCPIVGRVSMDLIVLDVSAASDGLAVGDRAEFFGLNHSIDAAAAACGTIGYELLTGVGGLARARKGLGGRVHRRYLWNDTPAPEDLVGAEGI
jgi:alanine racemase